MKATLDLIRNHPREFWQVLWVVPAFAALFTLGWIVTP